MSELFHGAFIDEAEVVKMIGRDAQATMLDICRRATCISGNPLGDQQQNAVVANRFYQTWLATNGDYGWSDFDLRQVVLKNYINENQYRTITGKDF